MNTTDKIILLSVVIYACIGVAVYTSRMRNKVAIGIHEKDKNAKVSYKALSVFMSFLWPLDIALTIISGVVVYFEIRREKKNSGDGS